MSDPLAFVFEQIHLKLMSSIIAVSCFCHGQCVTGLSNGPAKDLDEHLCELGISNWIGFGIWLIVGLGVYFLYGYRHSKLRVEITQK